MSKLQGVGEKEWFVETSVEKFMKFTKGIERRPEVLRFMDVLRRTSPPLDVATIANHAGIPEKRGMSYFKWLSSMGVKFKADYSHSALGLSLLLVKHGRYVDNPPKKEWVFRHVHTGAGSVTIYRYPRVLGPDFIIEEVRKISGNAVTYTFEELFFARPSYEYYWIGDFPSPRLALKMLHDHPRFYVLDYPINDRPPSHAALFILSVLERDALIKDTELARLRWRTKHPRRKIAKHLQALREASVLRGTVLDVPQPTSTRVILVIKAETHSKAMRIVEEYLKYLYSIEVGVGYDTVFVTLAVRERYAPLIRKYVELRQGSTCIDYIVYDLTNITEEYVLPYWNYDPLERMWSKESVKGPSGRAAPEEF